MGDFFLFVDVEDGVGESFWLLMLQDWGLGRGAGGAEVVLGFLIFGNFGSSMVSISWNIFNFCSKFSLLRLGCCSLGGLGGRRLGISCFGGRLGFFFLNFVDFWRPL